MGVGGCVSGVLIGECVELVLEVGGIQRSFRTNLPEECVLNGYVGIRCARAISACVISTVAVHDTTKVRIYWKIMVNRRHKSLRFI